MFDALGGVSFKMDKVTRMTIEDAEAHEMLYTLKAFLREEIGKRLPKKQIES